MFCFSTITNANLIMPQTHFVGRILNIEYPFPVTILNEEDLWYFMSILTFTKLMLECVCIFINFVSFQNKYELNKIISK